MANIGNLWINIKANTKGMEKGLSSATSSLKKFGKFVTNPVVLGIAAITGLTIAFVKLAKVTVRFAIASVKSFAKFQSQMQAVKSIMVDVDKKGFDILIRKAKHLGIVSAHSATQVAQGMEDLARAGFGVDEIERSIEAVGDLAASQGIELSEAANIVAIAVRGFGMKAKDAAHIADVLAVAASRANTTVLELGDGFAYVAPVAASLGFKIEETVAMMAVLADVGMKGTMGATGLRVVMAKLAAEISERGTPALREWLEAGHSTVENLLKFGIRGFVVADALAKMTGKIDKLTKEAKEADGVVKRMAETRLDALAGDVTLLASSFDVLKIEIGEGLSPVLRAGIQTLTDFLNAFTEAFQKMRGEAAETTASTQGWVTVFKLLSTVIEWLGKKIASFAAKIEFVITLVQSLWDWIVTGTKKFAAEVALGFAKIGNLFGIVSDKTVAMWEVIRSLAKFDFMESIKEGAQGMWSTFKSWFGGGAEAAVDDLFDEVNKNFDKNIKDEHLKGKEIAVNILKGLQEGFNEADLKALNLPVGAVGAKIETDEEGKKTFKFSDEQIKALEKMHKAMEKTQKAWDFFGWSQEAIEAHQALAAISASGGDAAAEEAIRRHLAMAQEIKDVGERVALGEKMLEQAKNMAAESLDPMEQYTAIQEKINQLWQDGMFTANEMLEIEKAMMKPLTDLGTEISDSLVTPMQELESELDRLQQLWKIGVIPIQDYWAAVARVDDEMKSLNKTEKVQAETKAMAKGVTEGLQTAMGTIKIQGAVSKAEQIASQELAVSEKIESGMKQLIKSVETQVNKPQKIGEIQGLPQSLRTGLAGATVNVSGMDEANNNLAYGNSVADHQLVMLDRMNDNIQAIGSSGTGGALT